MKKKFILIILVLIILISGAAFIFLSLYNKKVDVILKSNLEVPYMEKVTNLSFIKKVKNGKIITKSKNIDTSKLGSQKIKITLKNDFGKKQHYNFSIKVIDNIAPVITGSDTITTTEGVKVDLLKDVKAIDNVDNEVEVTVVGEYDFNKVGTYTLNYVAKDKTGNEAKLEFKLIVNKKVNITSSSNNNIPDKTFTTSKGFSGVTKNGLTYINGVLIANKTYILPSNYGNGLTNDTQNAFNNMKNAASSEGLSISIISGFRSYDRQKSIYNNYVAKDGKEAADRYSARPGHSEHQTGLAVDINSLNTSFENTNEGKWLKDNSYKYGFILRYPKNGEEITGYMYEPWHFRYVGVELATKLYNNGNWITLEEYYGITSKY